MKNKGTVVPDWISEDNKNRTTSYSKNEQDEEFLYQLNEILVSYEEKIAVPNEEPYPIIFFFGLPRCGKTVFSQLLIDSMDLGYPNNIVARFWLAPVFGIRLSNILLQNLERKSDYTSDYGKTKKISDPHDFSYFTHHWLKIDGIPYDSEKASKNIDWDGFRTQLIRMSDTWGKTAVFKGVNYTYHIKRLSEAYKKTLFIYLERDYIDVAVSLYKGRIDNYGDKNKWYGQTPKIKDYNELMSLPYNKQIGGQIYYLNKMFNDELAKLDGNFLKLNYRSICEDPQGTIKKVTGKIKELYNYDLEIKKMPSKSDFKFSIHNYDIEEYDELIKGLESFGLPARMSDPIK